MHSPHLKRSDVGVDAAFLAHPDLAEPIFDIVFEVQCRQAIQHQRQPALLGRVASQAFAIMVRSSR